MGNQISENFDLINKARTGNGFNYCILKYSPWIFNEIAASFKLDNDSIHSNDFKDEDELFEKLYHSYIQYPPLIIDAFICEDENESSTETINWQEDDNNDLLTQDHTKTAGDIPNIFIPTIIDTLRIRLVIDIEELVGHGILSNWLKKAKQVITYGFTIVRSA